MDTRVERTRRRLQAALLELAREHPLDDITVGDITERADVHRSSFYQHYADKETLLADALDAAVDAAEAELGDLAEFGQPTVGPPRALIVYLSEIAANAEVYRRVLGDRGSAVVAARVRSRIDVLVREGVTKAGGSTYADLPIDVVAAGITGSALGVIGAWLERDPLPPVDLAADWLWRVLLGPGGAWR